ncbi:MAG: iron-containing alcohol dehydrogenase [Clostridiales Family XIII bacterium]|jgi:alcohol dehydrogenase YqhD (iron-dependent ADH family)|nr:iron-containing alcohol dehydrogenase [Clostridiales Family XIII bacterium]
MSEYKNFHFLMDAEVVFGRGAEQEAGRLVKAHGGTRAMLVFGGGSIKRSGLYDRLRASLEEAGVACVDFGGVHANPRRSYAEEGVKLAVSEKVDFLLAAGGGSSIDTAKSIALALAHGGEFWKYFKGEPYGGAYPVGAVNTIAAAGSEMSRSAVLVDDVDTGQKTGLWCDAWRPRFAAMNPELTFTVPKDQTAAGSADIVAHVMMRYFSPYASALGDRFCQSMMRTVVDFAPKAVEAPDDYAARAELMLSAGFAHCDISFLGRPAFQAGEHALESQLSGHYDTAHGAGLAVMMPAMLGYFVRCGSEEQVARVAKFGHVLFGADPSDASDGVARFAAWLKSLSLPGTLRELGVPEGDLEACVDRCLAARGGKPIEGYMTLDRAAVEDIYRRAYSGDFL